jgi:tetratricopeptide (TPR) repeat protein
MRRVVLVTLAVCVLAACSSQSAKPGGTQVELHVDSSGQPTVSPEEEQVLQAMHMIQDGKIMAALDGPLATVVAKFEAEYPSSGPKVYSARGMTDAIIYSGLAMTAVPNGKVEVIGPAWAMAYWARGYAYGEMARYDDERRELEKALALAPLDAQYNNELAYTYIQQHDLERAMALYQTAEQYADITAPETPNVKCTALRGQGYVLVEQHHLDEAEAKYRACLKLTPHEPKSLGEIGYIEALRKKQP